MKIIGIAATKAQYFINQPLFWGYINSGRVSSPGVLLFRSVYIFVIALDMMRCFARYYVFRSLCFANQSLN